MLFPTAQSFKLSAPSASCPIQQVHLYTYNPELRNVPAGVVLKNACDIMPDDTQNQPYKCVCVCARPQRVPTRNAARRRRLQQGTGAGICHAAVEGAQRRLCGREKG